MNAFRRVRWELLPPPAGGPPPSKREVFGEGGRGNDCIACGLCGDVLRRPRGLGGDFEFLPLKSPRNPITPIETSRVATLHPGLYKGLRKDVRRVIGATAKPLYAIGGKTGGFDRRVNPVRWREETFSTECGRGTPSTACGRSPSLEEGGLWGGGWGNDCIACGLWGDVLR